MWIIYAIGSAFFAGITSILAKCGIKKTDSDVATAVRTVIVLIFSWLMVVLTGNKEILSDIPVKTWIFLLLSGIATGAAWLCYFRALQLGNINKVVPIDKSSTILTMIFALLFFREGINGQKIAMILLFALGTYLMLQKKKGIAETKGKKWMIYAFLSAFFSSLTAILGKIGIEGVDSNLGTAIRTVVVLIMAWLVLVIKKKKDQIRHIQPQELGFLCLSGVATGASWLCYYKALKDGIASVVVPIDKLSIVITILFSYFVFHEKLSSKAFVGLMLILISTIMMAVIS